MTRLYPPGPSGGWLSGSLPDFVSRRLEFLTECAQTYGKLSSFRLGTRRVVLVNDPVLTEQVLFSDAKDYIKFFGLRMYRRMFGSGLILSEGDFWLAQRRLAQPFFLRNRVAGYAPTVVEFTERMIKVWKEGDHHDVSTDLMHLTGAITLKVLFGIDDPGAQAEFDTAHLNMLRLIQAGLGRPVRLPDWVPTPNNLRLRRAVGRMDSILDGLIAFRSENQGEDYLTRLRQVCEGGGGTISRRQLRDELMTMFVAGRETTALTVAWAWSLLAQHPAAEEQIAEEWRAVLGHRPPQYEDLARLPYTNNVVAETLRLYPAAVLIGREAAQDVTLGDYRLPRGTTVLMSQWVSHRDPQFFDDPLAFRPERWENGLAERLPKCAYYPFGAGPRVCIGNQFAKMEASLITATVGRLWRFTLDPSARIEPWPAMTLRPRYGIPVILKRRTRKDHSQMRAE